MANTSIAGVEPRIEAPRTRSQERGNGHYLARILQFWTNVENGKWSTNVNYGADVERLRDTIYDAAKMEFLKYKHGKTDMSMVFDEFWMHERRTQTNLVSLYCVMIDKKYLNFSGLSTANIIAMFSKYGLLYQSIGADFNAMRARVAEMKRTAEREQRTGVTSEFNDRVNAVIDIHAKIMKQFNMRIDSMRELAAKYNKQAIALEQERERFHRPYMEVMEPMIADDTKKLNWTLEFEGLTEAQKHEYAHDVDAYVNERKAQFLERNRLTLCKVVDIDSKLNSLLEMYRADIMKNRLTELDNWLRMDVDRPFLDYLKDANPDLLRGYPMQEVRCAADGPPDSY